MLVKKAAQDETDRLGRRFDGVAPPGRGDRWERIEIVLVVGVEDRPVGSARMDVNRHVQRLGALEDRPETPVIEEDAARYGSDQGALEAESRHRPLELFGG